MNLKTFNKATVPTSGRQGSAILSMNTKAGLISFSRPAVEKMKLTDGDAVQFFQDEDRKTDWYIRVDREESSFKLRFDEKKNSVAFNCTPLAKEVFQSLGFEKPSGKMLIGEPDGSGLFPIITKSIA